MKRQQRTNSSRILAIKVHQWLPEWEAVSFDERQRRRRPDQHFYIFSLSAPELRALSGINRRTTQERRLGQIDLGIQRRHDPKRSQEIREYVRFGYP